MVTLAIVVEEAQGKSVVVGRSEAGKGRMASVPALRGFVEQSNSIVDSGYHTSLGSKERINR